jgi:hypothetical protein
MTTETYTALELLRQCNNLLECVFWAADSDDARGQAISGTIMEAQEKLEAAVGQHDRDTSNPLSHMETSGAHVAAAPSHGSRGAPIAAGAMRMPFKKAPDPVS